MQVIEKSGIDLISHTMIERYGVAAGAYASNRAEVLEACGDRKTSTYWKSVCARIGEVIRLPTTKVSYAVLPGSFGEYLEFNA